MEYDIIHFLIVCTKNNVTSKLITSQFLRAIDHTIGSHKFPGMAFPNGCEHNRIKFIELFRSSRFLQCGVCISWSETVTFRCILL